MKHLLRPHPVVWLQNTMGVWWPVFVSVAAVCLVATMGYVTWTVVDERTYFEEEAARDRRQDQALADLLEAQQADEIKTAAQVAETLAQAEQLLAATFAAHDQNTALKLNELLHQIAALLQRPAGTAPNPVHAIGDGGTSTGPPPAAPRPPAPSASPTAPPAATTTTTTTPDQRGCSKRPSGPRC